LRLPEGFCDDEPGDDMVELDAGGGRKRKDQEMVACFGRSRKPDRYRMGQLTANCGPEMGVATAQGFDGGELL
jgi:hypothetical protein